MSEKLFVRPISDPVEWDEFVAQSPQGTVFSTSKWLNLFDRPYHIYGYYHGHNLIGGMANFDSPAPITPFQGILVKDIEMKYARGLSLYNEVATALLPFAPKEFYNHWTFPDIRPFKWAGWKCDVRYTFVVDLTDMNALWDGLEKQTLYEITHARKTYGSW